MKKLLFLSLILASANCFAQTLPPFQWPPLDAFNKTTGQPPIRNTAKYIVDRNNDSLQINQRITALEKGYNALPVINKEVVPTVQNLNTIIKGLRDTINMLKPVPQDTSWKKEIRDLKADNAKQAAAVQELTTKMNELWLWYERIKQINFK
ncbi:MAG: hypothetical protein EKK63_09025 [Acinetobacter sp.]|uniref:hypothetical protein n=1 Tax=Acinetobacter sp. TaxID=472 RepID=UPI000FB6A8E3|nr:hypothetical protein [Acinetobacter sp.]RUP39770.1 MAG: hypothetical protein EKK63_09025 [Acinetobacter sp.]